MDCSIVAQDLVHKFKTFEGKNGIIIWSFGIKTSELNLKLTQEKLARAEKEHGWAKLESIRTTP